MLQNTVEDGEPEELIEPLNGKLIFPCFGFFKGVHTWIYISITMFGIRCPLTITIVVHHPIPAHPL